MLGSLSVHMPRTPQNERLLHPMLEIWRRKLGDQLSEVREKFWPSKMDAFGQFVGLTRQSVSRIENGALDYGVDQLLAFLAGLAIGPKGHFEEESDAIKQALTIYRKVNQLTAEELSACRKVVTALNDKKKRALVRQLLKALDTVDGEDADSGQTIAGAVP